MKQEREGVFQATEDQSQEEKDMLQRLREEEASQEDIEKRGKTEMNNKAEVTINIPYANVMNVRKKTEMKK